MDEVHEPAAALIDFARSLRPDESRGVVLERVAGRVLGVVADADAVSVTLYDHGRPGTIASTSPTASALDQVQYSSGAGPCLDSVLTGTVVRAELDHGDGKWPALASAAVGLGIRTALSCPLFVPDASAGRKPRTRDGQLSGAVNVWSARSAAFDRVETALIALFTSAMSAIVLTGSHWSDAERQAGQLVTALESRDAIATAKGIVMARLDLTADDAFRWLTAASQHTNRKLRDVAAVIIADPGVVLRTVGTTLPTARRPEPGVTPVTRSEDR
ncbi:GAF and ANTAR domain-containing protein [Actinosynnema sp. NPDC023587]|uniref:GAF and ANTAR domain-containing protein n=1 Tax=Actinosynnema sp. NPDC023587 TaxID=3154695 RepID=UPI0033E8C080